jgi:outer membrane protein assembly factor BamB
MESAYTRGRWNRWLILTIVMVLVLSGLPSTVTLAERGSNEQTAENRVWLPLITIDPPFRYTPSTSPTEWTQDAHDAQRTGYTLEDPHLPWTLLWTWNGPNSSGGSSNHFYDAPREARTVTGGSFVYVPAGSKGMFALYKTNGKQAWNVKDASFNATPAFDAATDHLYAGGADGKLYKIDVKTGKVVGTYQAGDAINKAVMLVDSHVYALTKGGHLHKVKTTDMSKVWVYSANSSAATPPAYSKSRGVVVFATHDLHVHAVNQGDGSQKWRVKPTPHPAVYPYTFDGYWPVVADINGVVFVRMNLGMDALFSGPLQGDWGGGVYPHTNSEIRALLEKDHGKLKNLFALNLDNGSEKFTPAVGYGGVEGLLDNKPALEIGPVPVVRVLPNGTEIAYSHFRSAQGNPKDGRWDSHMGEMVLNNNTIPGLASGDLRFIRTSQLYVIITDEQTPISMAGNTLFHAHWGASESFRIVDRSNNRGLNYDNPITTEINPTVIRRMQACSDFNPTSHWTKCGLTLFDDSRYWNGPGWWVYWNVLDPPTPSRRAYSEGVLPRYTYVSDGLVIVEGNGGELFVLKHSGQ